MQVSQIPKLPSFKHIHTKAKKNQILEGNDHKDKYTEIERENRMLLEKMHKIMRKTEIKANLIKKDSLNLSYRQQNYEKINKDNRHLLERLKKKQANYSAKTWADERKVIENRILMISHFQGSHKKRSKSRKKEKKYSTFDIRRLVYKKGVYLKSTAFLIEIYKYPSDVRILAINGITSEIYRLILSHSEIFSVMKGLENWDYLTNCLQLENDALVLCFPS